MRCTSLVTVPLISLLLAACGGGGAPNGGETGGEQGPLAPVVGN